VLGLVAALCAELEREGVAYCHWKSNEALDRSANGDNDLDLLVARPDSTRFLEVLHRLGFQEARLPSYRELPGVVHYYGLDVESSRLVHVHAQYQLIFGDDTTKNYRLPIEDAYLGSSEQGPVFSVPSAEFELVVLVLRMLIKHATWDAALYARAGLSTAERREVDYLAERSDRAEVERILADHLPFLTPELWFQAFDSVSDGGSARSRLRVGRRLLPQLHAHTRRSPRADTAVRMWRRASWGTRRYVFRRRTRKKLVAGGAVLAFVGGDGSGKSSAVAGLTGVLSRVFETRQVHLGKPPRSLTTQALKGAMAVGRKAGLFSTTRLPAYAPGDEMPGMAWLVWHVLTARDRLREYRRARRFASNGGLVVCDRFPLPEVRLMDGSRTAGRRVRPGAGALERRLVEMERRCYAQILEPDVVMVLRVDPAVAVARRPEDDPVFVRTRNEEIWSGDWTRGRVTVLDASRPQDEVLAEALRVAWAGL
jgi:thymidylate kinase